MLNEENEKVIDKEKIKSSIRLWLPLCITTHTLPRKTEMYMQDVLEAFLTECHQEHMISALSYCLGELVTNAKKANTKRVYFKEKGLDIYNEDDYNKGMKSFKSDTLNNIDYYLNMQKEEGLYVTLLLQEYKDKIKIEIRNNADLTVFEYKRIHDKLARAQKYSSVEEVLDKILDDSEGAGLGIVIIILMLEKIGLAEENYQVLCENGETITRIILPVNKEKADSDRLLTQEFTSTIDSIPVFKEKLLEISNMLDTNELSIPALAQKISKDISLSIIALYYVNKEMNTSCISLPTALEILGHEKLKEIYNQKNPFLRFINRLDDEFNLWEHSPRVAFYAFNIARNLASADAIESEEIYMKGLLHDLGRIFFTTATEEQRAHLQNTCRSKNISVSSLAALQAGLNHGYLGSLIAKKWNFPEHLVETILHHHDPLYAPRNIQKSVAIIYVADMMARYNDGMVDFYQIDKNILNQFNIITEEKFSRIAKKAEEAFSATLNS